jgi:hypothetical protein
MKNFLPVDISSQVVLSVGTRWNEVVLEQHRLPSSEPTWLKSLH